MNRLQYNGTAFAPYSNVKNAYDNKGNKMNPKNPKVTDKRAVRLESILSGNYIPLFEGRPKREEIINEDDKLNLEIALNSAKSWEDFLRII